MRAYVEQIGGAYRVAGSRVSLDSIVYAFRDGQTPENIAQSFPVLTLEQVYGAITYYLSHQAQIDAYIEDGRAEFEAEREAERKADPAFYARLAEARKRLTATR